MATRVPYLDRVEALRESVDTLQRRIAAAGGALQVDVGAKIVPLPTRVIKGFFKATLLDEAPTETRSDYFYGHVLHTTRQYTAHTRQLEVGGSVEGMTITTFEQLRRAGGIVLIESMGIKLTDLDSEQGFVPIHFAPIGVTLGQTYSLEAISGQGA